MPAKGWHRPEGRIGVGVAVGVGVGVGGSVGISVGVGADKPSLPSLASLG